MATSSTASIRTLRNEYARLVERVERGQSVTILRHGKPVARLVPVGTDAAVDWSRSAALALAPKPVRDETGLRQALRDSKGRY
jgi:prevent-host-death family protein